MLPLHVRAVPIELNTMHLSAAGGRLELLFYKLEISYNQVSYKHLPKSLLVLRFGFLFV